MENTAAEMVQYEDLSTVDRGLHMLEYERAKYRFFMSVTQAILFEYVKDPPMLTLSSAGVQRLGLAESTVDPYSNEKVLETIGPEALDKLAGLLRGSAPDSPVVEFDCHIRLDGQLRPVHIISRAMWSADEPPQYIGAVGRITELDKEEEIR